jgi:hypothetical protein
MKKILSKIYSVTGLDHIALAIVLIGMIWTNVYYKFWRDEHRIIVQDVILYYEYLPATFIYKDLSMSFTKENPEYFQEKIWKIPTKTGKSVSKMTMGLAVLYTPFFLAAHVLAEPLGYAADGYTIPYRIALIISSMVYAVIGFLFLIKLLRKYFARGIIALTVLAVGLGTNLYFYTTIEPTMSHAYSFFLFALFFFLVDAWVSRQSWANSLLMGLVGGLIILVRPSNGIIYVLLLLWQVGSFKALIERIKLLLHNFWKMAATGIITILVFMPQVIYWKYTTGDYFFYSYGEEHFFFNDPAFIKGMFSYRKGWLVYTPIMVFSLLGIIVLYFKDRKSFWPVLVYTFLNLYIIWSWWCWWYGGGFGQRALIESYAVLAFPFAAFAKFILERKIVLRVILLFFIAGFISLNIYQTRQYYVGIIHWDSMSKYNYWDTYFRRKVPPNFYNHLEEPDYQAALKGDR